ncbi:Pentatricopeptide repeat-containing protein [Rhynchospora pubera]|nr:Pentatricopeptide repeat-containing protein [Rhynchospora pubera]
MIANGVLPNAYTCNNLILGFCGAGDIDKAFQVYEEFVGCGLRADVCVYNTLLAGCCKHGAFLRATKLLQQMIERCCKSGRINEALQLVEKMMKHGLTPDEVIVDIVLDAVSKSKNPNVVKQIIFELGEGRNHLEENSNH